MDMRLFSNFGCKLHKFLIYWNGQTTAMVLITMTTERFITISFPHQTKISITKKKLASLLIMLSFCAACLTSHFWWTHSLYNEIEYFITDTLPNSTTLAVFLSPWVNVTDTENSMLPVDLSIHVSRTCSYENSGEIAIVFMTQYWPWINLAVYSLLPFFIITTINVLLLIRLSISIYERKKKLGQVHNTFQIGSSSLLLISAGLLYLFCTGPIAIYHILKYAWRHNDDYIFVSSETKAQRELLRSILENMSYLTNALNILVYCISGSRFRRELILMLFCTKPNLDKRPLSRSMCKSISSLSTSTQN